MGDDKIEPPPDKTNKMNCAPSEDTDQPGHLPSLIRVFAVRMKKAWVLSYPLSVKGRLWSDWVDAQPDLSLRWEHSHFVGFVMLWIQIMYKSSLYFLKKLQSSSDKTTVMFIFYSLLFIIIFLFPFYLMTKARII